LGWLGRQFCGGGAWMGFSARSLAVRLIALGIHDLPQT
jgi:hypothetical protein